MTSFRSCYSSFITTNESKTQDRCIIGYTHFFSPNRNFTGIEWHNITKAVKDIFSKAPSGLLCNGMAEVDTSPTIDDATIKFNGCEIDDQGHETFCVTKLFANKEFNFCKTAQKPYDLYVVATLCVMHSYAPGALNIRSNGAAPDWAAGLALAQSYDKNIEMQKIKD